MQARFTAIYEKGDKYYIGYCPEVPGANGQGETIAECRESLTEAVRLLQGEPEKLSVAELAEVRARQEELRRGEWARWQGGD